MAAGVFATALVPVGMHLWPHVPAGTSWSKALRVVVMSYICLAAAVVNLVHAVWLLVGHPNPAAENIALAILLITAVEALMVMASLARRRTAASAAGRPQPADVEGTPQLTVRDLANVQVRPTGGKAPVVAAELADARAVSATVRQLRPSPLRQSTANVSRACVAMPGPSPTWPQPPRNWTYGAQTWRDACEAHYRGMGRPTLMTEFGLTKPNHARQVSDAVRPFKQGEQVRA
jgi:hypothetical protein